SQPLAARGARARATEWSRSRRYAEAGTAWSKDTASRSIAASSAARASRSFSAGVSGGSRMAGTIARVGGRASRTRSVDHLLLADCVGQDTSGRRPVGLPRGTRLSHLAVLPGPVTE